jgi:hypothetical protein
MAFKNSEIEFIDIKNLNKIIESAFENSEISSLKIDGI